MKWLRWLQELRYEATPYNPDGSDYDDGHFELHDGCGRRVWLTSRGWHKFGEVEQTAMAAAWLERMSSKRVSIRDAIWIERRSKEIAVDE